MLRASELKELDRYEAKIAKIAEVANVQEVQARQVLVARWDKLIIAHEKRYNQKSTLGDRLGILDNIIQWYYNKALEVLKA